MPSEGTVEQIEFIRGRYLNLREAIVAWLQAHFEGEAWLYQPTPLSNSAAWIVPHLVVFEQIKVFDRIPEWQFPALAGPALVERYKPGASGYAMARAEHMSLDDALALIARAREVSGAFLADLIAGAPAVAGVDRDRVFDRYLLNFTHDTEHYGQLKYLSGTWERKRS